MADSVPANKVEHTALDKGHAMANTFEDKLGLDADMPCDAEVRVIVTSVPDATMHDVGEDADDGGNAYQIVDESTDAQEDDVASLKCQAGNSVEEQDDTIAGCAVPDHEHFFVPATKAEDLQTQALADLRFYHVLHDLPKSAPFNVGAEVSHSDQWAHEADYNFDIVREEFFYEDAFVANNDCQLINMKQAAIF